MTKEEFIEYLRRFFDKLDGFAGANENKWLRQTIESMRSACNEYEKTTAVQPK